MRGRSVGLDADKTCTDFKPSRLALAAQRKPMNDNPDMPAAEALNPRARATAGRLVLAGGLGPENVRAAIDAVSPWAVDASSSLESEPGVKDHARVRAFVAAARHSRPWAGMARKTASGFASDFPTGREGNG